MTIKKILTVDDYISAQPKPVQEILNELRSFIKELLPNAEEKISYGMPTYKMKKNLVHFAAYEHHIGFYPTPSGIASFQAKLARFKQGKGSVQFPIDQPMPYPLIKEIVEFRLREDLQ